MKRREFLELSAVAGSTLALAHGTVTPTGAQSRTRVVVVTAQDPVSGLGGATS